MTGAGEMRGEPGTKPGEKVRVLIAGAGVAGLEAMLALRELAGDRVKIEVLTPQRELNYWPLLVTEPFGRGRIEPVPLEPLFARAEAAVRLVALTSVDAVAKTIRTGAGETIEYDALIVACGGAHVEAVAEALTFPALGAVEDFRALLDELAAGQTRRVAFALPSGAGWPLPLYELALLTAAELEKRGARAAAELTVVTPESDPLGLFGTAASEAVRRLLDQRSISILTQTYPVAVEHDGLTIRPGGLFATDRVVALARLEGPGIHGIPQDANGFIPVDAHGQVVGVDNVYAAGDAVAFPIKQGGLAAQQATAVAELIAAKAGANLTARPFRPILRGLLLTGGSPRYLRSELTGGYGDSSSISSDSLWWPPAKIAGRYLPPALAELAGIPLAELSLTDASEAIPVGIELSEPMTADVLDEAHR